MWVTVYSRLHVSQFTVPLASNGSRTTVLVIYFLLSGWVEEGRAETEFVLGLACLGHCTEYRLLEDIEVDINTLDIRSWDPLTREWLLHCTGGTGR